MLQSAGEPTGTKIFHRRSEVLPRQDILASRNQHKIDRPQTLNFCNKKLRGAKRLLNSLYPTAFRQLRSFCTRNRSRTDTELDAQDSQWKHRHSMGTDSNSQTWIYRATLAAQTLHRYRSAHTEQPQHTDTSVLKYKNF